MNAVFIRVDGGIRNEAARASAERLRGGSHADDWVFQFFIRILRVMLSHHKMWSPLVSRL